MPKSTGAVVTFNGLIIWALTFKSALSDIPALKVTPDIANIPANNNNFFISIPPRI